MFKNSIKDFNLVNIICFQNSFDPFVSFKDLENKIKRIDKTIKIVEKSAKDHDYYYSDDFRKFLLN